ncbi:DNA-binding transcriptional regulator [uncultured Ramlibacter sp.]|uniref:XylR family transcriptional regulator n=1 Tax=uncultured Ramlibacter sp. TaxID=260755 RepID=UPI0026173A03|nr:DNA-binding transcriptional regulator [uncultured Ramlibacter sp.]
MRASAPPAEPKVHRVALLFHASKVYDREIIAGIGSYVHHTRVAWDLFLEEDFRFRLDGIADWHGDGIIADFDDPAVSAALSSMQLPVVAVGSSYADEATYPAGVPYVATDNQALVQQACGHLIDKGLRQFACYSLPESPLNRWAQERERAFETLMLRDGMACRIHRGLATSAPTWDSAARQLVGWLQTLPKPVGIIAVTDARARQLLQACILAGLAVPDEVALVGIDNDTLGQHLTRIQLSSVSQGTHEMGRTAAHLLHQMLGGAVLKDTRIVVPPAGIHPRASTQCEAPHGPYVMRALHYIRQYACQGIKTEQVATHVGLSRSSLETWFRRELRRTVHDEILLYKLQHARTLLQESPLSGAEVASRSGFGSVQYLNAVFKRELGCTPREYRERAAAAQ